MVNPKQPARIGVPLNAFTSIPPGPDQAPLPSKRRKDSRTHAAVVGKAADAGVAGAGGGNGSQHAPARGASLKPDDILTSIFTQFSAKRKADKVGAWMYLQTALAENAGTLCPISVSLKDLIAATANIEDMLKGQSGDAGESPSQYLERFLNSKPAPEVQ